MEHFLRDAWWGGGYEEGAASRDCVTDDPRWDGANPSAEGACSWPGTQWYQTYRLAVDGGSRLVDYFASAEYQNDTYALPLDRLERYALRTNVGAALSQRVEARLQAAYSNFRTANTASGNNREGILLSTLRQERNYLTSGDPRDIANLLDNRNHQWIDRFTAGLSTTFSQSARASHRLTLGYDFSRQDLRSVVHYPAASSDAAATTRAWDRRLLTLDYLSSYGLTPGRDLRSTITFGAQLVSDELASRVRSGVGFADDEATNPGDARSTQTLETTGSTTTTGLFGQNVLGLQTSLDLRPDAPDLWQERCAETGGGDYWFDGDYFKLRSVTVTVPLAVGFSNIVRDPTLSITLANAYTWYREVPWWDLEILGNDGANGDGFRFSERVPAPTTVTLALRVTF